MKRLILPDIRESEEAPLQLETLREFAGLTIEDLVESLIEEPPPTDPQSPWDFKEAAVSLVCLTARDDNDLVKLDVDALLALIEETMELIFKPVARIMSKKDPGDKWAVMAYIPGGILVGSINSEFRQNTDRAKRYRRSTRTNPRLL